jgi:hypothetical protein
MSYRKISTDQRQALRLLPASTERKTSIGGECQAAQQAAGESGPNRLAIYSRSAKALICGMIRRCPFTPLTMQAM